MLVLRIFANQTAHSHSPSIVLSILIIVKHRLHVCLGSVPGPLGGLDTPGLAGAGAHLLLLPPTLPATRQVLLITTTW